MGFSLKELIRAITLTRLLPFSHLPPLPAAFPSPPRCLFSRSRSSHCISGTIRLSDYSLNIASHFVLTLIGSLILFLLRNPVSPPGVTPRSSVPCRPHTPWYDGWMSIAFASTVQARPCPIFGRPVHHGISPSIAARYFSSCPSDSTSRWTPCPPRPGRCSLPPTLGCLACSFTLRFQTSASISPTIAAAAYNACRSCGLLIYSPFPGECLT